MTSGSRRAAELAGVVSHCCDTHPPRRHSCSRIPEPRHMAWERHSMAEGMCSVRATQAAGREGEERWPSPAVVGIHSRQEASWTCCPQHSHHLASHSLSASSGFGPVPGPQKFLAWPQTFMQHVLRNLDLGLHYKLLAKKLCAFMIEIQTSLDIYQIIKMLAQNNCNLPRSFLTAR